MSDPFWRSPFIAWIDDLPAGHALLVCSLRTARQQAKVAAVFEALTLLSDYTPRALLSGPAAEQKGVFWVALPRENVDAARALLPKLGYTVSVELAEPASGGETVRWHGTKYRLIPLYHEDAEALREQAPDRREFLLPNAQGEIVAVRGYRGDGQTFGKRGLPVYDARLLVNLAGVGEGDLMLDPYGGIGGVILAGRGAGARVVSVDSDPVVAAGLAALGDGHVLGDARRLPFEGEMFDAIATEPPYDREENNPLNASLSEMVRVLRRGGRLALLCAGWQVEGVRERVAGENLRLILECPINRKGLDVFIFVWQKT